MKQKQNIENKKETLTHTSKEAQMPKLNYTPNKNYPLIISKPSPSHKSFFIYEEDEIDPVISSKHFSTEEKALEWAKKHFPTYTILIQN